MQVILSSKNNSQQQGEKKTHQGIEETLYFICTGIQKAGLDPAPV